MTARTLAASDFDAVHAAFTDAFSDYVVKLSPTREQLLEMLTRRGYVAEASVAAFEGERIVAFTLNGVEGDRAYDSGTGVVPSHRRQGLARAMMLRSFDVLRARGCRSYVLEVLEANTGAFALYRDLGFEVTRGLQCWSYEVVGSRLPVVGLELTTGNRQPITPSWQNSDASIARARDPHVRIGGEHGHVILFPSNGDVARFHGTITPSLLAEAAAVAGKPLRIMNIDERDEAFSAFLADAGAKKTVRQWEMLRAL